jgi:hypothetical protein
MFLTIKVVFDQTSGENRNGPDHDTLGIVFVSSVRFSSNYFRTCLKMNLRGEGFDKLIEERSKIIKKFKLLTEQC